MRLESFSKPLDSDVERKNLEGTYTRNNDDSEIDNYDLLFDDVDPYIASLLRGEIDEDDRFALEAARSESDAIARGIAESEMEEPWSSNDIGKEFINTPTAEKKQAEQQDYSMDPLENEVFQEIADEADKVDLDLQARFEKIVAELEGVF